MITRTDSSTLTNDPDVLIRTILIIFSYAAVFCAGLWIGNKCWRQKPFESHPARENNDAAAAAAVTAAVTAAATAAAAAATASDMRHRSIPNSLSRSKPPNLYCNKANDSEFQFHRSQHCQHAVNAPHLDTLEPCLCCTGPKTYQHQQIFCTTQGTKYHNEQCNHIQKKLAATTSEKARVHVLTPCQCVREDQHAQTRRTGFMY